MAKLLAVLAVVYLAGCASFINNRPNEWTLRNPSASGGDFATDNATCTDYANQTNASQVATTGALDSHQVWNNTYTLCMTGKGWTHTQASK
jgi:hypothetical protein